MWFRILSVLCLPLVVYGDGLEEKLYKKLNFSADERAKVLILDKQMQILQVISVQKGQKELKLNLQDSDELFVTFVENPQHLSSAPLAKDSKYLKEFANVESKEIQKESATTLKEGVENASFERDISRYEARFERNRLLGDFLGFEPYKFNYLLPASVSFNKEQGQTKRTEAKFQISIKKLLIDDLLFKDLDFYFAYTQQSFWQIYDNENSRPFRESNYEPTLYFSYPLKQYNVFFDRVNFGYVHQSNGEDLLKSRSWDRLFIEGIYGYENFVLGLKAWYRIKEDANKDDNPDILDYMGYGELSLGYGINKHLFTLTLRNNLQSDNRGAFMLDYSYPLYKNLYLYVQYFSGYGESLADYNHSIERVGAGFLFVR
ncbi:phospholipase A [Helicobacter turcicus]|uniref:Phosphatidylcholine 1-acylhydrolase n=1 Tax=Helicobacter turcicus TaxID=2867412 RepID=A0ABS7JMI3_9HELI|nr:phospholipase A [Helicobacter turcicus]MBX7490606.1 phospholipase A [Helicobacter turcicus]MBX7545486.1 phospholipase A [Helicobacter turcicus]